MNRKREKEYQIDSVQKLLDFVHSRYKLQVLQIIENKI